MNKRTIGETLEVTYGRLSQACQRYNLGRDSMRQIAKQASAVIHIGNIMLISYDRVDAYLDALAGDE